MALGQRSLAMTEQLEHTWWKPAACAIFGVTLLQRGDQAGAVEVLERGLAVAEQAGVEAYLLRCAAPLADATGSPAVLARADRLLEQATIPAGGAWLLGEESYLCLARAWLEQGDAERARAILSPLLTVADRVPWTATLAATLALDGRALLRLGEDDKARARLLRAERIAGEHGLPHVRHDARSALHSVK